MTRSRVFECSPGSSLQITYLLKGNVVTAVEIVEFKIDIDSGSRDALGAFRFDNLRITVMCYSSGDTSDKPKETFYKVTVGLQNVNIMKE